jgi:hypothetical protein
MTSDARQLLRLRTLRVQRARERCAQEQAGVEAAVGVVRERRRCIENGQRAMKRLAHQVVHALAPALPRWIDVVAAQRARLADRLERDEYALIDDERRLEEAQERLQQARAELTRTLAREDAVRGLADRLDRAAALVREQRVERELDDQARLVPRPPTRRSA